MQLSPDVSQVLADLVKQTSRVREERKVWSLTLHAVALHFEATAGALFLYGRATGVLHKAKSVGGGHGWRGQTLLDFFHNRKPELPEQVIMAPVRVGRRVVGVLALERPSGFHKGAGKEVTEVLKVLGRWIGYRRDLAEQSAECGISRAILSCVRAKDVTYRILHQLRRFIDYDHGATVLGVANGLSGRVLARQVAWTKGRSGLVGSAVSLEWRELPPGPGVVILDQAASSLWASLEVVREDGSPPKKSIMIGCLVAQGERSGIVEVSSRHPGFFLDKDVTLLSRFLPYLAWCATRLREEPEITGGSNG
jgi:hypothetical protein